MGNEYTPTTEQVRKAYKSGAWLRADGRESAWKPEVYAPRYYAEFDRWLASEKAKWQAEALRHHRRRVVRLMPPGLVDRATVLADLDDYADRIEKGWSRPGGG